VISVISSLIPGCDASTGSASFTYFFIFFFNPLPIFAIRLFGSSAFSHLPMPILFSSFSSANYFSFFRASPRLDAGFFFCGVTGSMTDFNFLLRAL